MNLVLTNNFYTWMRTMLLQASTEIKEETTHASAGGVRPAVGKLVNTNGAEETKIVCATTYDYPRTDYSSSLNAWSSGMVGTYSNTHTYFNIGNDNTPAGTEDYRLGSAYVLNTDYTAVWRATGNAKEVNGKGLLTFNLSVTAINPISIGEIGMFKTLMRNYSNSGGTANQYEALFGRATLDTPIELVSGESATFQVTVEI